MSSISRVDIRSLSLFVLATAASMLLLHELQPVIVPLVLAAVLFYALAPAVNWLVRWHIPRVIAAVVVMVAMLGGIGSLAYSLSDEAAAVMQSLPDTAQQMRKAIRGLKQTSNDSFTQVQKAATTLQTTADEAIGTTAPRGVTRVQVVEPSMFSPGEFLRSGSNYLIILAGELTTIVFLALFMLISAPRLREIVTEVAGPTLTKRRVTTQMLDEITFQVQRFLIILVLTNIIVAVLTAFALWMMGLQYPVLWGLVAGLFNSVPYFGPVAVTAVLGAVGFVQFGSIWQAASVAGVALAITSLEGFLITPVWQGRVARMNNVAVFVGLLFWSWMWGPIGLLLAIPLTTVVKVICDHVEDLHPVGKLLGE